MKIKWVVMTMGCAAGIMAATSVQALPYATGEIDMSGTATLDSTLLGSATMANSFSSVVVGGTPTGAFAGTSGDSVNWNSFGWNPSTTPVAPLWTFTDGATTYTFNLANVHVVSQNNSFLNLAGNGTLQVSGYADTSASWSFTISNSGGGAHANYEFTFANSQTAVPDGGTTVMLLGAALTGLGLIRRKLFA